VETARSVLGRRRIALARRALEIWPGCAAAWLFLSQNAPDLESAREILARGVDACRPELAPDSLPFLELLRTFGDTLAILKRCEEAAAAYAEILELAPHDPVGARYGFASVLLALDRDAEAVNLLDGFSGDSAALLAWPRVLLGFRREGDSLEVRRLLKKAWRANGLIAGLLLEILPVAKEARRSQGNRGDHEAGLYLVLSCDTWKTTPGALEWLRTRVAPQAVTRKKKRKR
jgi:tetratricopeptide (TPR) repeat protein